MSILARYRFLPAAFALVLFVAACNGGAADPARNLVIETDSGSHTFTVELADTDEARQRGLMFREDLPPDTGMLFDFSPPRRVSMWMRNTPLPLDMIFITPAGRIAHIAEKTVPFSEAIITSPGPVAAVFEVHAGTAGRLGIKPGDRVRHPFFADEGT